MRFLLDGKPRANLTAEEARKVTPWHKSYEGSGAVLSLEGAARQSRSGCLLATASVTAPIWVFLFLYMLLRDPRIEDSGFGLMIAAVGVIVPILALAFGPSFSASQHNKAVADSTAAPPPGTRIRVGEEGLSISGQLFPWDELEIEALELYTSHSEDDYFIRPLSVLLSTPAGPALISSRITEHGQWIVFEIHRRLWPRVLASRGLDGGAG